MQPLPVSVRLPSAAVGRMSLYLRESQRLAEVGIRSISSTELGRFLDVSPAVVRKDLAAIGAVGRRGVGYPLAALMQRIGATLGSEILWNVVLVGAGSLGHALLRYRGLERQGFRIVAAFDADRALVGSSVGGVTIQSAADMPAYIRQRQPQLAILAVPAEAAQEVASELSEAGISGILNFSPISLKLPRAVGLVNVDLASEMQRLAFTVSRLAAE
jgi:redox-sensing transcriptional repressor